MRVVVTGASGFIGRRMVSALARRGVEVVALGRKVLSAETGKGVVWQSLDIETPHAGLVRELAQADVCIHLVWDALRDFRNLRHFEVLLPAHYQFLKSLVEAGLPSLCVVGTCLEYGMQSGALREELPAEPVTAYGHAKLSLYRQLVYLKEKTGFALNWVRFFYLYGDGQPPNTLYAQVQTAIAARAERFPMSPGEQLRDYLHVDEAVDLLARLALSGADAGVVNLCSGKPVSIRSLVEGWFAEAGMAVRLDRGVYGYPPYEPLAFWGDRSKLSGLLQEG